MLVLSSCLLLCRETINSSNKLIIFTRSSSILHNFPNTFPSNDLCKKNHNNAVSDYVFQNSDKVMMQKMSSISSQNSIQEVLTTFVETESKEILVLIANMQTTSTKIINHIRFMIEESELKKTNKLKLYVIILHYSPNQFIGYCYPALFLRKWDHYYLDTISTTTSEINVPNWLLQCWFDPSKSEMNTAKENQSVVESVLCDIIPVLSARMMFGNRKTRCFNCAMTANDREKALKYILDDLGLGRVICKRYCEYWKPLVMFEYLEQAALLNRKRDSILNITDSTQAQFKSHFIYFSLYMLTLANEDCNLDSIYQVCPSSATGNLFLDIFEYLPAPELDHLCLLCSNLSPPAYMHHCYQFPFFGLVYNKMEKYLDICSAKINFEMGSLAKREGNFHLMTDSKKKLDIMTEQFFSMIENKVTIIKCNGCIWVCD